ncbi:MAG: carbohydrate-binding family 9-like protein [Candidatus Latescibacterota bacterium]
MRKVFLTGLLITLSTSFLNCGKANHPSGANPFYTVRKAVNAPVVDGTLGDACWKDLPAMEMELCSGGKPRHPTSVRMTCDDTNLYVGFECQDLDAASNAAQFDGPVTDEEHVMICIAAGSDTTGYFMIAVSPTGAVSDAFVLNRNNGAAVRALPGWNCEKLRASVAVYGDGARPGDQDRFWTVELAIPFTEMLTASRVPPVPGDTWRINSYRLELTGGRELSASSPTGAEDVHRPRQFMVISFGE